MTIFEYLSIAASIFLALALGKLASAIPLVFSKRQFDPIYSIVFAMLFSSSLLQWWLIWGVSEFSDWTFPSFLMLMASPIVLFVLAHVLVSENPSEVCSWRDHLSEKHRLFFSLVSVGILLGMIRGFYFLELIPSFWTFLSLFVVLSGAVWNNRALFTVIGLYTILRIVAVGWGLELGT